jgi:membrane-bound lytic murein transglycosylase A
MQNFSLTLILSLACLIGSGTPIFSQSLIKDLEPLQNKNSDLNIVDDLLQSDRQSLLNAIDHSLRFIKTGTAAARYANDPILSRDRVERSLIRFRQLVQTSATAQDLDQAVLQEFDLYKSVGTDQKGTVHFTGYFEAVFPASRTRTAIYKYPLYRLPRDFSTWTSPHPSRAQLENSNRLKGLELVWFSDRFSAFLVHVQGSARLQLTDGKTMTVGYAGKTDQPYSSIGKQLVKDGKMKLEEVTLQALITYFQQYPQALETYLPRNQSFVFFRETFMSPAIGSIGVPVTAERSIATDKSLMPPGAIALISTSLPFIESGKLVSKPIRRFVLDQDTGGAIKGAGRVDIFMGTGKSAQERSGVINTMGELYYLMLKE